MVLSKASYNKCIQQVKKTIVSQTIVIATALASIKPNIWIVQISFFFGQGAVETSGLQFAVEHV